MREEQAWGVVHVGAGGAQLSVGRVMVVGNADPALDTDERSGPRGNNTGFGL